MSGFDDEDEGEVADEGGEEHDDEAAQDAGGTKDERNAWSRRS